MTTQNEHSQQERVDLESKVLAAAFKQSIDLGDSEGAQFAHRQLFQLLRAQQPTEYLMEMAKPGFSATAETIEVTEISSTDIDLESFSRSIPDYQFETEREEFPEEPQQQSSEPVAADDQEILDLAKLFTAEAMAQPENGGAVFEPPAFDPSNASGVITPKQPVGKASKPKSPPPTTEKKTEELQLPEVLAPEVESLIQDVAAAKDIYGMLGLSQYASYELIHKSFLKRARKLLMCKTKTGYARSLLEQLRNLWIAHDILVDPKTRNDYDFRVIGLKSTSDLASEAKPTRSPTRQSKIGELFEASGLLEPTELQIACDMHKAMPEMQFGRFLVKQGFLEEEQLQAVLAAQRLIRTGKLTLSQFKEAMSVVNNHTGTFSQVLLEKGFCSKEDLAVMERIESETARKKPSVAPTGRDIAASSLSKVSIGNADDDQGDLELDVDETTESADRPMPPKPRGQPAVKPTASPKRNPISEKFAGRSVQRPADKIRNEIKITHQRLHSMIEDYETRTNTPIVIGEKNSKPAAAESSYTEIDQIDASEIDPHYHDDTDSSSSSEKDHD
jgi:hypothetical protein